MTIFINNKALETLTFSGGESHVRITPADISDKTTIMALLHNAKDIMNLLLAVDAIRRINSHTQIDLTIPYFPYGRQDRVCNPGEALSIKVMAELVNSLNCHSVTIYDPHSDVTPALINHCKVISLGDIVANSQLATVIHERKLTLLSPDAGAEKKLHAAAKKLLKAECRVEVVCASKTRDISTGEITASNIHGATEGKDFIILDDICDGGRTFIELAKILKENKSGDVYLYVTHGIFSNGLGLLQEYFKHVYCYHTLLNEDQIDHSFLTILQSSQFSHGDAK